MSIIQEEENDVQIFVCFEYFGKEVGGFVVLNNELINYNERQDFGKKVVFKGIGCLIQIFEY